MPKGSMPRSGAKILKTRPVAGGAQQYVRGDTAVKRYMTAKKASETAEKVSDKARFGLAKASAYERTLVPRKRAPSKKK